MSRLALDLSGGLVVSWNKSWLNIFSSVASRFWIWINGSMVNKPDKFYDFVNIYDLG